jgi:hypothetical protein
MKIRISNAMKAKKEKKMRSKGVDSMSEKELRAEVRQLRDKVNNLSKSGHESRMMIRDLADLLGVSGQIMNKISARRKAQALKQQIGAQQPQQQQPPLATAPAATNPNTVAQQQRQQIHPQRQLHQCESQVTPQAKRQRIGTSQQQHQYQHQQYVVSYGNW